MNKINLLKKTFPCSGTKWWYFNNSSSKKENVFLPIDSSELEPFSSETKKKIPQMSEGIPYVSDVVEVGDMCVFSKGKLEEFFNSLTTRRKRFLLINTKVDLPTQKERSRGFVHMV